MNNLVHGMVTAAGRVMSLATVASRHMWIGLTALAKKDRDDLLGAPVATEGLFKLISSVTQRFSRLEGEREQLSRMLPLARPQASPQAPGGGKAEREAPVQSPQGSRRALCLRGPSRGTGPVPALTGTGCHSFVAGRVTREYHSFIAGAPQLIAHPLTQCYGEWTRSCVLTVWMDLSH